jgi:hypothetical protein
VSEGPGATGVLRRNADGMIVEGKAVAVDEGIAGEVVGFGVV